jgi:hypothetical protein
MLLSCGVQQARYLAYVIFSTQNQFIETYPHHNSRNICIIWLILLFLNYLKHSLNIISPISPWYKKYFWNMAIPFIWTFISLSFNNLSSIQFYERNLTVKFLCLISFDTYCLIFQAHTSRKCLFNKKWKEETGEGKKEKGGIWISMKFSSTVQKPELRVSSLETNNPFLTSISLFLYFPYAPKSRENNNDTKLL